MCCQYTEMIHEMQRERIVSINCNSGQHYVHCTTKVPTRHFDSMCCLVLLRTPKGASISLILEDVTAFAFLQNRSTKHQRAVKTYALQKDFWSFVTVGDIFDK